MKAYKIYIKEYNNQLIVLRHNWQEVEQFLCQVGFVAGTFELIEIVDCERAA